MKCFQHLCCSCRLAQSNLDNNAANALSRSAKTLHSNRYSEKTNNKKAYQTAHSCWLAQLNFDNKAGNTLCKWTKALSSKRYSERKNNKRVDQTAVSSAALCSC